MGQRMRELRAAQNRTSLRTANELWDAGGELLFAPELAIVCECVDDACLEKIPLSMLQLLAIESEPNRFIVVRGHESIAVDQIVAERDGFLIVSVRD